MNSNRGKCRKCGRAVRWVVTQRGKNMPIDPHPDKDGNVLLASTPAMASVYGVPLHTAVVLRPGAVVSERMVGTQLYSVHMATCPKRQGRA